MGPFLSMADVLSAIRRRFWLMSLVFAIGATASVWYALHRPRLFEATAVLQIEAPPIAPLTIGGSGGGPATLSADQQIDLIQQQLMARDNLLAMVDRFALFPDLPGPVARVGALRGAVTLIKLEDPAQSWRPEVQPSGLIITVRLDDPETAAAVANDFLAQVLRESELRNASRTALALEFLQQEETRVRAAIDAVESRIASFRAANVESLPEGLTAQRDRLTRLTDEALTLDRQLVELAAQRDRIRADELERQETLLRQGRELVAFDIARIEAALARAPDVERELTAMTRELSQLEAELSVITARRTEAAMARSLEERDQSARMSVLEQAIPPEFPVSASRRNVALAGAMLSGMAALALGLVLELLNPALRTAAQVERQLGAQPVIVVPRLFTPQARRLRRLGAAAMAAVVVGVGIAIARNAGTLLSEALQLLGRNASA